MLYLGWLLIVLIAGEVMIGNFIFLGEEQLNMVLFGWPTKLFVVMLFSLGLVLLIRMSSAFRDLMQHFMNGDIFSLAAVTHVKRALFTGMFLLSLYTVQRCAGWYLNGVDIGMFVLDMSIDVIVALAFFGAMYTLLWTLEIGCDLNDESEMTI